MTRQQDRLEQMHDMDNANAAIRFEEVLSLLADFPVIQGVRHNPPVHILFRKMRGDFSGHLLGKADRDRWGFRLELAGILQSQQCSEGIRFYCPYKAVECEFNVPVPDSTEPVF